MCSHQVTPPVLPPQSGTSSVTIATPGSSLSATSSSLLAAPSAAPSSPLLIEASTRAPIWAGSMLGKPQVVRERLGRFVFPPEVNQIGNLGIEGVIFGRLGSGKGLLFPFL